MNGKNGTLIKIGLSVMTTLIAVVLFYFTFMDRRDTGVRAGVSVEARVTALEVHRASTERDIREIRNWVQDLHTVLVRGQPAPIRAHPGGGD